ncbi:hypothetical protein GCK72_012347 [Caenorhabditis remanei]|uniref:Uncharacterized protein n=1 Tax=Caenorhabditis remanei TaxID=31234 RepID=A0A6A5GMM7_CAERE|nr:hypothetical protein GCK72_012347 [Caenorhabditis remanei]KAF1755894.1 hypothetical protein GCK72_012347 [Caenorhabditis remanei]
MVRETKAQADKKAADVERKRANRKQEHLNSGGDSQEPQKKRTEMSQEELRVYWADQKRIKREKQRSLQSSQLSACSQETQLSEGRKKIKDMNPEELSNYRRQNREACRKKGRTSTTSDMELSQRTSTSDFNFQHNSQFDMESLHSEMSDVFDQPTSSNAAARIGRKRMMSPQE